MPINIPNGLPAKQILESEKIFALEEDVARKQDIRPLRIVILNLMPKKIETETQILRLISKSPLQVDIDFMMVSNHVSKNTSADHLLKFYDDFSTLKKNRYDCLIITGAPVEHLEYGKETLAQEYFRDLSQGKEIQLPFNYFPEDDPQQEPVLTWRSHANLLYRNWLNYVYQMTPYDLQELSAYKQEHNVAAASV